MNLDEQIRLEIGKGLIEKAGLPVDIEGEVRYNGELTIEYYREIFPDLDNPSTIYLTLRYLLRSVDFPERDKELLSLTIEKECAIYNQNFERAIKLRDKIDANYGGK